MSERFKVKFKELQTVGVPREYYDGAYTVTPSESIQTIATDEKAMSSDVTVLAIPSNYFNTSDANGVSSDIPINVRLYGANGAINGSATNNGAVQATLTSRDEVYTIPPGFHNGYGAVTIDAGERSKLISDNIRRGITVLGVSGGNTIVNTKDDTVVSSVLRPGYTAHDANGNLIEGALTPILQSKTAMSNGTVIADSGYDGLGVVTVAVSPPLQSKLCTENSTVEPDAGYYGLGSIVVNVPQDNTDFIGVMNGTMPSPNLPEGLTKIKRFAFYQSSNIVSPILPSSLMTIGSNAFYGCVNLNITLPQNIEAIESAAFFGCTSLAISSIPASILSIEGLAFRGCTNLRELEILGNPTISGTSDSGAFLGCSNLTSVTLGAPGKPMTAAKIPSGTFKSCPNLTSITVYTSNMETLGTAPFGATNATVTYVSA